MTAPHSEDTTQPILCCIGHRVAGKPTQFVLERAIALEQLDWRVITVEVAAEDFEVALRGMAAMHFTAVRFFPSVQSKALACLTKENPDLQFVAGVTTAIKLAQGGWNAWHHLGPAVAQWCRRSVDFSKAVCWLKGDSLRCRSFLAALPGQPLPRAILWQDPPVEIPAPLQELRHGDAHCVVQGLSSQGNDSTLRFGWKEPFEQATSLLWIGDEFDATPGDEFQRELQEALPETIERILLSGSDTGNQSASQHLPAVKSIRLSEVDQALAGEAFDLWCLTGRQVSLPVLRDAYDEYCDF